MQSGPRGAVKIGSAKNPKKRMAESRTGNPKRLELLAVMPGGEREERELHREFRDLRRRGEWYRCVGPLRAQIKEIRKKDAAIQV